ncbi:MAG: glycosyltransferase, partial [Rhodospirillales bacterium]
MRLFCLADQATDWIPKQILAGFCRHTNHELVDTPSAADLIWVQSYYADLNAIARPGLGWRLLKRLGRAKPSPRMYRLPELAGKPVLVSLHHLTPGREHEFAPKLAIADRLADAYHFFSSINIPFIGKFVSHPGFHLPYWIDLEQFRPLAEAERVRIRRDLELPAGRRIIGSFQRDTEADGISPKPEKGPDLLCDILEHLERDTIFVLLSGPRRAYVERRLASAGIPFRSLGHSDAETMNALYNALDVYLVTSRTEGGPQAILECMAIGTPILSTPVG